MNKGEFPPDPRPEDIETAIPETVREFVRVRCRIKAHPGFGQLCRAIGEAFQRFQGIPIRWREIDLILVDDPPMILTPAGALSILPKKGTAALTFGDTIFLRADTLLPADFDFQVYAVLEELTHALLNVQDESLVTWIVCFLYSERIAYQDGHYVSAASFQPHWPPTRKDWATHHSAKELDLDAYNRKGRQDSTVPFSE